MILAWYSLECIPCCMSRRPEVTQHDINTRRQELIMCSIGWSFCTMMACEQHPHERLCKNQQRSSYSRIWRCWKTLPANGIGHVSSFRDILEMTGCRWHGAYLLQLRDDDFTPDSQTATLSMTAVRVLTVRAVDAMDMQWVLDRYWPFACRL